MRYIVFDTETTGIDPSQGNRVIEIGCVEIVNRKMTGNTFHYYLNPDRDSEPGALQVHGLTTEFLADKPRFGEIYQEFLNFIKDAELIAHNAAFDEKFMNAEFSRLGLGKLGDYCHALTDSLVLARNLHPGKRNSLDALCDRYGISNAQRTYHGALLDSQLLAEVWLAMTRGQEGFDMGVDAASTSNQLVQADQFNPAVLKVFTPTQEELAEHEKYLDALDKASGGRSVWRQLMETTQAPDV